MPTPSDRPSLPAEPPPDASPRVDRRAFVQLCSIALAALAPACPGRGTPTPDASDASTGDASVDTSPADAAPANYSGLPTLGGAPDTYLGHTIAAFVDTVIPGAHRDPLGKPGGIDVGAPALFFDPQLPAAPLLPLVRSFLDGKARTQYMLLFVQLTPEQRDRTLESIIAETPLMEFAIQLARLAFFSSDGAGRALGYPGANPGYRNDPNFSFGVATCTELTTDGNYP